jgi:hypothetical protein
MTRKVPHFSGRFSWNDSKASFVKLLVGIWNILAEILVVLST